MNRRQLLTAAGGTVVGLLAVPGARVVDDAVHAGASGHGAEPFYGQHQAGIQTAAQAHVCLAAFDLQAESAAEVAALLRSWTSTAAGLTARRPADRAVTAIDAVPADTGEAIGLGASRLTLTFGFGPGLFSHDGEDRYGLAAKRPAALIDLPAFPGDELVAARSGGDLTVQACADDPQVAFHAIHTLMREAAGVATLAWTQTGFTEASPATGTPRNLMGFKDGTINPHGATYDQFVWVGQEGPAWMRGGTYAVYRRISVDLGSWDAQTLAAQQHAVGRYKGSGAYLGERTEFDPINLEATDGHGNPVIPATSHVRLASANANSGMIILRRSYSFSDSATRADGSGLDSGLLFCAYQRDPRNGFVAIYSTLAGHDGLSAFTTHTGSAIVAVPPAAPGPGAWVGQTLFEA